MAISYATISSLNIVYRLKMWNKNTLTFVNKSKFSINNFCKFTTKSLSFNDTSANTKFEVNDNDLFTISKKSYLRDQSTNVTPHILSHVSRNLHLVKNHPLNIIKQRIINYMYGKYVNRRGNPLFSVYDKLSPVVTIEQNFDALLIPDDHPSRKKSDTYYINSSYLLRTHTSAHQKELILSGLDNFLVIGDVYRRDEIDAKHYPVFHQCEGVQLLSPYEVFKSFPNVNTLKVFENDIRRPEKQESHTLEAAKLVESELKRCLEGLVKSLFGSNIEFKWTDTYFPFTHPSWELEILKDGIWLEVLGCGIMEQKILEEAGAGGKIGWAFGLGLERLAMILFNIPDIRLFWSQDSGFLSQFDVQDINAAIKYKPISRYPQCINDISFWVPENYHSNDFYDIARSIGGEIIEQVYKKDEFFHPKHKKQSYCYRIIYRHMERTLTQQEVNEIHKQIEKACIENLKVDIR